MKFILKLLLLLFLPFVLVAAQPQEALLFNSNHCKPVGLLPYTSIVDAFKPKKTSGSADNVLLGKRDFRFKNETKLPIEPRRKVVEQEESEFGSVEFGAYYGLGYRVMSQPYGVDPAYFSQVINGSMLSFDLSFFSKTNHGLALTYAYFNSSASLVSFEPLLLDYVYTKNEFNIHYFNIAYSNKHDLYQNKHFLRFQIGPGIVHYVNNGTSAGDVATIDGVSFNLGANVFVDFGIGENFQLSLGTGFRAGSISNFDVTINGVARSFSSQNSNVSSIGVGLIQLMAGIRLKK
jgi:hypothetical protein